MVRPGCLRQHDVINVTGIILDCVCQSVTDTTCAGSALNLNLNSPWPKPACGGMLCHKGVQCVASPEAGPCTDTRVWVQKRTVCSSCWYTGNQDSAAGTGLSRIAALQSLHVQCPGCSACPVTQFLFCVVRRYPFLEDQNPGPAHTLLIQPALSDLTPGMQHHTALG